MDGKARGASAARASCTYSAGSPPCNLRMLEGWRRSTHLVQTCRNTHLLLLAAAPTRLSLPQHAPASSSASACQWTRRRAPARHLPAPAREGRKGQGNF